jgi:spore coat polysaccharide biosynthesis protein SpsF (cytidylyltransferase family)
MALRVLAVVQARLGSTRLPGKALADIAGRPMVAHVIARIAAAPGVDEVVLATTSSPADAALAEFARSAGIACVRGSVDDVLDRFWSVARAHPTADAIVRVTGDCPLLDPAMSGRVVGEFLRTPGADYASNVHPPSYPDGLDTEVISRDALERAWRESSPASTRDREHVTPYIWERRPEAFRRRSVEHGEDLSALRWTVDDARDLGFARAVHGALAPDGTRLFGMEEVLALLRARPRLAALNAGTPRNEGYERSRLADLGAGTGQGS